MVPSRAPTRYCTGGGPPGRAGRAGSRRATLRRTQRSEACANLFAEGLRLLPSGEVSALGELVVVNEFRIGLLRPTPRGRIELVREDAHGNRDRDAFGVEIPFAPILPVQTCAGQRRVRQPRDRDVVEDVVAREPLGLPLKDA